jgi:hypothetical protein
MYTAMAVVALTLGVTSGNLTPNPVWLDDYGVAQAQVAKAGKPMVVFVGAGKDGHTAAVREGAFDPAIAKLLSSKFVCLYVDTNTASGRKLADAFQIKNVGVVISNKSGLSQVFSSPVAIPRSDLERALVVYAEEQGVQKTDTVVPAGGPVYGGRVIQVGGAAPAGGPGYMGGWGMGGSGWGMGGGGGKGGCCGFGGGYGKGFGGGCFGKGQAAPVVLQAPPAKAPVVKKKEMKMEMKKVDAKLAPGPVMVAQPMGYGGCFKGGFGGCCGFGGGKGWGGGYYRGGCK